MGATQTSGRPLSDTEELEQDISERRRHSASNQPTPGEEEPIGQQKSDSSLTETGELIKEDNAGGGGDEAMSTASNQPTPEGRIADGEGRSCQHAASDVPVFVHTARPLSNI